MMRQEDEAPSDFQDYTLVAITAVAAHLVKVALGDDYGLKRLGERYGHDLSSLDQVGAVAPRRWCAVPRVQVPIPASQRLLRGM